MKLPYRERDHVWVLFDQTSDLQKPDGEAVGVVLRRLALVNCWHLRPWSVGLERCRTEQSLKLNLFLGPITLSYSSGTFGYTTKIRVRRQG